MNKVKKDAFGESRIKKGISIGEAVFISLSLLYVIAVAIGLSTSDANQTLSPEVSRQNDLVNTFTDEYDTCSTNLSSRFKGLNQTNEGEVDSYNNDVEDCENVRKRQNIEVDKYNQLLNK